MPFFAVYLPLIYLFLKDKKGLLALAAAAVSLVVLGRAVDAGSLTFLQFALDGFLYAAIFALLYRKGFPLFTVVAASMVPQLVLAFLCQTDPGYRKAYDEMINFSLNFVSRRMGMEAPAGLMEQWSRDILFPMGEFSQHMVVTCVLLYLFAGTAGRPRPSLSAFTAPDGFVWVFAGALALALFQDGIAGKAASLMLIATGLLYLLNGIAIVRLFFLRVKGSRTAEAVFYIVQPGLLFMPLLFLGLFETWFSFRKRILSIEIPQNTH